MSDIKSRKVIAALILSIFDDEGPTPKVCLPESMDYSHQMLVAMKSISLLMGEQIYQNGEHVDSIKYFGILPFPDLMLTGLTYFFLIKDAAARGRAKASTISLLVHDSYSNFLYENMKQLSVFVAEVASKMNESYNSESGKMLMNDLLERIQKYINNVETPVGNKRNLKILFTGLDASGKTSYLKAIKQKYSELIGIKPTKGIERSEQIILGTNFIEWDIGGQAKYRQNFLDGADLYLYDTNLVIFLIDVKDATRYAQAVQFLTEIIQKLRMFNQFPPIIVNFHKVDPDVITSQELRQNIKSLQDQINKSAEHFKVGYFETSIFNNYSLIKAFSAGIGLVSPNREIFERQLEWLASQIHAQTILLINENSIILSDYSTDKTTGVVSEMSAPHFHTLFRTFSEFRLLKGGNAVWNMDNQSIIFTKLDHDEYQLYLLCLIENQQENIKKLEQVLPEFIVRTSPLLKTFL